MLIRQNLIKFDFYQKLTSNSLKVKNLRERYEKVSDNKIATMKSKNIPTSLNCSIYRVH